jgi:hypothetical protein
MSSSMTRQHFRAIADAFQTRLKTHQDSGDLLSYVAVERAATAVGRAIGQFNYNFDYQKFMNACRPVEEKEPTNG